MKRISTFIICILMLGCSHKPNRIETISNKDSVVKSHYHNDILRFDNLYPEQKDYPITCQQPCYPKTKALRCKNGDENCQYLGKKPSLDTSLGYQVRWLGHASFYLTFKDGTKLLIDPVSGQFDWPVNWAFWLQAGFNRQTPGWLTEKQYQDVDAVLYSHIHYDHFNKDDIALIGNKPEYLLPLGIAKHFPENNYKLNEMAWYSSKNINATQVHFVPAHHFSSRIIVPFIYQDKNTALWGGYVIEHKGKKLFFAGDTGYSKHFSDIHARYGDMDVCLLPIASYFHAEHGNWYRYVHTTPEDALTAAQELNCQVMIPWGYGNASWKMGDHSSHSALRRLLHMYQEMEVAIPLMILNEGETVQL